MAVTMCAFLRTPQGLRRLALDLRRRAEHAAYEADQQRARHQQDRQMRHARASQQRRDARGRWTV